MILGIDLGTSSVKALLISEDQTIVRHSSCNLSISRPHPNWSEQDPEDWWKAVCTAVEQIKPLDQVKAIGLSGQMHGAVLLNSKHQVLRPAILWNDGRSMLQCRELEKNPDIHAITGNRIMPGFTAPKLLWIKENEPSIFNQVTKVLLPKDYVRLKLSGDFATDLSDASGTMWIDVARRCWSDRMLSLTSLSQDHMPKLYEGTEQTGYVSHSITKAWGLPPSVRIIAGGGDNAAAAVGINVTKSAEAFISIGTSGVFFVVSDRCIVHKEEAVHTMCHCLPKLWNHMAVHLSAANCLGWLSKIVNLPISEMLHEVKDHRTDLLFLPYLSGERTPYNNPHARGVFFGLSHETKRKDLTLAVLEGVAFCFANGQDAMLNAHIPIGEVSVLGGGSENEVWGEILASALDRPLIYRKNRKFAGAFGAARLALYGKPYPPSPIEKVMEPSPLLRDNYTEKRMRFNRLYEHLRDDFT